MSILSRLLSKFVKTIAGFVTSPKLWLTFVTLCANSLCTNGFVYSRNNRNENDAWIE